MVCLKMKNVIVGAQNVYETERNSSKLNVLFTFNASGVITPLTVVYRTKDCLT